MANQGTTTSQAARQLRVWASGCPHVTADLKHGRESLADAIRQSEEAMRWDIALSLGDYCAEFGLPTEEEGREVARQFSALRQRESIYTLCGNHDRDAPNEAPGTWFQRWVDPMGENTATSGVHRDRYRHPVNGTFERYWFEVGNIRFLMMSDVNAEGQSLGRGELGGNPGGAVTAETFDWWVDQVEANHRDKIIVCGHHYVLKDTTVASGEWEGMRRGPDGQWKTDYHGYYARGTPQAASYLYWVGPQGGSGSFEQWLAQHPGTVDLWLGAHTHTHPDDERGGKSHVERRHGGTHFINAAALTRWFVDEHAMPHSRLLSFEDGSDELLVECYMHTDEYKPQGFYAEKARRLPLTKPYRASTD